MVECVVVCVGVHVIVCVAVCVVVRVAFCVAVQPDEFFNAVFNNPENLLRQLEGAERWPYATWRKLALAWNIKQKSHWKHSRTSKKH